MTIPKLELCGADEVRATNLKADLAELATMLDRLGAAFNTLSSFTLAPPSQQVLDQVRQPQMLQDWPALPCPDRTSGIEYLLASHDANEDGLTVRHDFNQLFVGPERMKAPPYESVHLSEDKLIFEQQTFVVRAAYAQFDLAAPKLNQEPDDHIGLELAFLGTLAEKALDSIETISATPAPASQDIASQTAELNRILATMFSFLDQHLLAWGPTFFTLVSEHSTTEFYRGIGHLGLGVLEDAAGSFGL